MSCQLCSVAAGVVSTVLHSMPTPQPQPSGKFVGITRLGNKYRMETDYTDQILENTIIPMEIPRVAIQKNSDGTLNIKRAMDYLSEWWEHKRLNGGVIEPPKKIRMKIHEDIDARRISKIRLVNILRYFAPSFNYNDINNAEYHLGLFDTENGIFYDGFFLYKIPKNLIDRFRDANNVLSRWSSKLEDNMTPEKVEQIFETRNLLRKPKGSLKLFGLTEDEINSVNVIDFSEFIYANLDLFVETNPVHIIQLEKQPNGNFVSEWRFARRVENDGETRYGSKDNYLIGENYKYEARIQGNNLIMPYSRSNFYNMDDQTFDIGIGQNWKDILKLFDSMILVKEGNDYYLEFEKYQLDSDVVLPMLVQLYIEGEDNNYTNEPTIDDSRIHPSPIKTEQIVWNKGTKIYKEEEFV